MLTHNWKHEFKTICWKIWEIPVDIFYIWLNNQNVTEVLWVSGKINGGHCAYWWYLYKPKISLSCDLTTGLLIYT